MVDRSVATVGVAGKGVRATPTLDALEGLSIGRCLELEESRLEKGVPRLSTGFKRLDAALAGGFTVPSLNILGAAPKSGKSTWAQIVATRHVEAGGAAYYLDLENGRRRFLKQVLCRRAELGMKEAAAALDDQRGGIFASRATVERWRAAKNWMSERLAPGLFVEFSPPADLEARLAVVRASVGDRPLLVVIDSLQKLPLDLEDRRAGIDKWIRFFERLRHELDAAFLVVSEIKRSGRGTYEAHEAAFKESGGIEYAADLAMTLTRPRADEGQEPISTLRVELARDSDDDPRGEVASYAPVFPFYGLEERDPAPNRPTGRRGAPAGKGGAAKAFLEQLLAGGPVRVADVIAHGGAAGFSRATVYRAKGEAGCQDCLIGLKKAWKLP